MIYFTVSTKNRYAHAALTMLSLINASIPNVYIHVIDDASTEDKDHKDKLFNDLVSRGLISKYESLKESIGFCKIRARFFNNFSKLESFQYWIHIDDDFVFDADVFTTVLKDYDQYLDNFGILNIFANPWASFADKFYGKLRQVTKIGWAAFIVSKKTTRLISNVYDTIDDGEAANAALMKECIGKNIPVTIKYYDPYKIQHTGNSISVIFGYRSSWENMWAKDFTTNKIVKFNFCSFDQLRIYLKSRNLLNLVKSLNLQKPIRLLLEI